MTANPILLQKKYSRVIECFAKQQGLSLDAALDFFYHSQVYQLIRDGVSDMHCMSDTYLAEELKQEYEELVGKISVIAYFSHSYLCRRRHKVARIAEQNWKFCSRFLRRKAPAEWRLEWIKKQRWK